MIGQSAIVAYLAPSCTMCLSDSSSPSMVWFSAAVTFLAIVLLISGAQFIVAILASVASTVVSVALVIVTISIKVVPIVAIIIEVIIDLSSLAMMAFMICIISFALIVAITVDNIHLS